MYVCVCVLFGVCVFVVCVFVCLAFVCLCVWRGCGWEHSALTSYMYLCNLYIRPCQFCCKSRAILTPGVIEKKESAKGKEKGTGKGDRESKACLCWSKLHNLSDVI